MIPPPISVVVPSYNPRPEHLRALYESLLAQTWTHFEVIVVDDASPEADYALLQDERFRVVRQPENRGPAAARNRGAAEAKHDWLFFTDTDCTLAPDCLERVSAGLAHDAIIMGDTRTRVETLFGRCVALLGFPGGGALGFHRVWRVDEAGYTRSFSSCNLAFHKALFESLGRFNETFPVAGGEDTVLARHAVETGHRIRYAPHQIVYHVERPDLRGFLRWQIIRGRGNYYIKRHVPEVGGYLRLRIWTYKNSLVTAGPLLAFPVTVLWALSVVFQSIGYRMEAKKNRTPA
ncbi:MAG: glycosyltransferase [Candidatus Hydrogenedens sp.]|nr:glycosyltransferase [Candidatus Hydrogenedens sp.]